MRSVQSLPAGPRGNRSTPRFLQSIAITSISRPRNRSGDGAGLSRRASDPMVQRCRVGVSSLDPCFPDAWGKRSRLAPLQARRAAASASNGARRRLDLGLGTPSQVPLAHLTGRRRWCGVPENVSRANLIDAHEPTVASDIGGQDRDEPETSVSRPRNSSGNGAGLSRRAPPDGATAPLPCRGFSPRLLLSRAWEEAFTTRALASEASGGFCIERRPPAPRSWARDPVAGPLGTPHRAKALVRRPREREPCKPHRCP